MSANQHVLRELRKFPNDMGEDCLYPVRIFVVNDNLSTLRGEIVGPKDSPYEGGVFKFNISVPSDYPAKPPKFSLESEIWHPNMSNGTVCVDVLKNKWSPTMSLRSCLLTIQQLMDSPSVTVMPDCDASRQFLQNRDIFTKTATYWTYLFANGPRKVEEFDQKIKALMKTGMFEERARKILVRYDWDLEVVFALLEKNKQTKQNKLKQ